MTEPQIDLDMIEELGIATPLEVRTMVRRVRDGEALRQRVEDAIAQIERSKAECAEINTRQDCGCTMKDCYDHGMSHNCDHGSLQTLRALLEDAADPTPSPAPVTCWCGGEVGQREPGDEQGLGCLSVIEHRWGGRACGADITHRDEDHRQSICVLPPEHLSGHDDGQGCLWTDALHWDGMTAQDREGRTS